MNDAAAVPVATVGPDARVLLRETLLVMGLFWIPIAYRSAYYFLHPIDGTAPVRNFDLSGAVTGLLMVGLIFHLSSLRADPADSFVGRFHGTDLVLALVIALGAQIAGRFCWHASSPFLAELAQSGARNGNVAAIYRLPKAYLFVWAVYSPIVEEVVMRGYLQTRLRQLGMAPWAIVLLSATLQAGYHLYQGVPAVIHQFGVFLVFAIAYQCTRRLSLTLGAHFATDLYLTLVY